MKKKYCNHKIENSSPFFPLSMTKCFAFLQLPWNWVGDVKSVFNYYECFRSCEVKCCLQLNTDLLISFLVANLQIRWKCSFVFFTFPLVCLLWSFLCDSLWFPCWRASAVAGLAWEQTNYSHKGKCFLLPKNSKTITWWLGIDWEFDPEGCRFEFWKCLV